MMRAVLIDDEISNLENLRTLLEKHCPQVTIIATAQRVSDAVDAIEKYLPNLVFLDIQMGEKTGFNVLKLLPSRRSEEHTSELQSLMRISYAVFCLKKKIKITNN